VEDELGDATVQDGVPEKLQPPIRFVRVRDARMGKRALPQWFWKDRYEVSYRHLVLYSTLVNAITTLCPPNPIELEMAALRSGASMGSLPT
jgi:hypothetical protein